MLDIEVVKQLYEHANNELKSIIKPNQPVIVGPKTMNALLNQFEKETGTRPTPNSEGVYKLYDFEVAAFDWDENDLTC